MIYFTYILVFLFNIVPHDFHMSKTEIHYKSDKEALQFTINLFIDDFTVALEDEYNIDSLRLFEKNEHVLADSLVAEYIWKHLEVSIDSTDIYPDYIGKELNSDDLEGMRCYFEVESLKAFELMDISNSILVETFADQRNILSVKVDTKSKAHHLLDKEDFKKSVRI